MLSSEALIWAGSAAVIIHMLLRVMKTDMLARVFASLGLPTLPKRAYPWAALGLGLSSGVLDALVSGDAMPNAIVKGVMGIFSGAGAVAGYEAMDKLSPPKADPAPVDDKQSHGDEPV